MERDFGISCPLGLPKDQEDVLDIDRREFALKNSISQVDEEKNKVGAQGSFF